MLPLRTWIVFARIRGVMPTMVRVDHEGVGFLPNEQFLEVSHSSHLGGATTSLTSLGVATNRLLALPGS